MANTLIRSTSQRIWGHDDLAVVCPACQSSAAFTSPYSLLNKDEIEHVKIDPNAKITKYGGSFAIERFPSLFPWNDSKNRYINYKVAYEKWGVITCGNCPYRKKHKLSWPKDAFYKIEFPFGTLWANNRKHLVSIRECLADRQRKDWLYSNRLPKVFFLARNRMRTLKGIDKMLAKPETIRKSRRKKELN